MILQYIFLQPWPDIIVQQVGRWNDRIDGWGICKIKKNILEKNLEKDKIPITTLQIMKKSWNRYTPFPGASLYDHI